MIDMIQNKYINGILVVCIVVVLVGGSYFVGYNRGFGAKNYSNFLSRFTMHDYPKEQYAISDASETDFENFWRAWYLLDKNFTPSVKASEAKVSGQDRVAASISGLASSYNDPYTVFIPSQEAEDFREAVNGEFQGIGAVLTDTNKGIMVIDVYKNSPAEKSGLKAGDVILNVNGISTTGVSVVDATKQIRGTAGSEVELTIGRGSELKQQKLKITRGLVTIPSTANRIVSSINNQAQDIIKSAKEAVKSTKIEPKPIVNNDTFVIGLAAFTKTSRQSFNDELASFVKSDSNNLIIDLRNNPGGLLDVSVDMASNFLPKDSLIVKEVSGKEGSVSEFKSFGYPTLLPKKDKLKVVVLVNKNSASAAEIFAGSLKDNKAAIIIGEKTFGKGSVQNVLEVGKLGILKVTIARWFTPLGVSISESGLEPDIMVNSSDIKLKESVDPIMDRALEFIGTGK